MGLSLAVRDQGPPPPIELTLLPMRETRLIHGFHAVCARLRLSASDIQEIYVQEGRDDARMRDVVRDAQVMSIAVHAVPIARLDSLTGGARHQGLVARVNAQSRYVTVDDVLDTLQEQALFLALDGITDPRNLGACLRAADAAGAQAVIAPKDRACGLSAVAIQVACGAAEHVPYITVTNLARTLRQCQDHAIQVIGASADAQKTIYELPQREATVWVLGAEGTGLRQLTQKTCDTLARIPLRGSVASLNVAVAAGICLFETRRQRSAG
jgi:23S rRNA (guanosine2251-2'-O)-methyltransferase